VKWYEDISNRVSIIIRRYTDYNRYRGFKSFIKCPKCTFRRRVRLFKISKLVDDGREIVRSV
jgi:hypothetical protein